MQRESFLDIYEEISSTKLFENLFDKTIINKKCKFCSKSPTETSFDKTPHVIPELLGKNNFTSNDECDACNQLFGRFETDLSNFISPYQTLISQKTKNKIPIFQSRKKFGDNSTIVKNIDGKPHIDFKDNLSDFSFDHSSKTVNINFKKKKFKPINVYKSLVKIALSLCPEEELIKYYKTIYWLSQEQNIDKTISDIPLVLIRTMLLNKCFNKPYAQLYKRKIHTSDKIYRPNLTLVVYSGILVFQIFIPFCEETQKINFKELEPKLEMFPAFTFNIDFPKDKSKITLQSNKLPIIEYDMNYYEKVEEDELVVLKYQNLD